MSKHTALIAFSVLLASSQAASAEEPIPARFESKRNFGLMAAGLGVFGGMYTISAMSAFVADDALLAIPVAGPIAFALRHKDEKSYVSLDDRILIAGMTMDALIQTGGIVMAVVGAVTKRKVRVLDRGMLTPMVGPGGAGLSGRF